MVRGGTFLKHTQSQYIGPADQSEHIALFRRRASQRQKLNMAVLTDWEEVLWPTM